MSEYIYLLKIGELILKGGNRAVFEKILVRNLAQKLRGSGARIQVSTGRFYVRSPSENAAHVERALSTLAGITGWARVRVCEKTPDAVVKTCLECAAECSASVGSAGSAGEYAGAPEIRFKVESRRTDKSFPLHSYELNCLAGDEISKLPGFRVNVHTPEVIFKIEVRERAFVWAHEHSGLRGLPVGSAGRGLLLLSGGIDSPVAGFMMALRGLSLRAVYFDAYPYTSNEAREKVQHLVEILREYIPALKLYIVSMTEVEERIKASAPQAWRTVLLRMAMFAEASKLAKKLRCKALVTGESLSQVASQTPENIRAAESQTDLPVFRPLIGMDKEYITKKAIEIGTYETSILPYSDCCTLFSPEHPVLHADLREALELYSKIAGG